MKKPIFRFSLRTNRSKRNGTFTIYYYFTVSRISKIYKSCYIDINDPAMWNEKKQRVFNSCPDSYNINIQLESIELAAKTIIADYFIKRKFLSVTEFERLFDYTRINSNSFYDFIENEIASNLKNKLATGTLQTYNTQISKLKKFSATLMFEDININFLAAYENYMIDKLHNDNSTIDKSFRFVRSVYNKAIEKGVAEIEKYPFRQYHWKKPKHTDKKQKALTIHEVNKLHELYNKNSLERKYQNVLTYFLFACYTGLRYSDVRNLKFKDIQENIIKIRMKKTSDFVSIPINDKAFGFIGSGFAEQKIFRVLVDQPTNLYLKTIAKIAGINKPVSFHWARHTFATICIELGFKIEIIKELLGHTSLKSTQIYSKVSDKVKQSEMIKWNDI
ncbi:MAG TPA: site-specific integrase [Bacteroidales bacterium]|nr:site-specific integrase [Bacteroidales bacterium]HPS18122.1 site-specific integrase [Bacteroidales bacterium]